jgi:hypothetical protein
MAFMNLDLGAANLAFTEAAGKKEWEPSDPRLVPSFTPEAIARYSSALRDVVRAFLQYEHKERPSSKALLNPLRHYTGLAPGFRDLARGARFGTRQVIPTGLALSDGLPANRYALGMAMPA